jgi:hypothetical protein
MKAEPLEGKKGKSEPFIGYFHEDDVKSAVSYFVESCANDEEMGIILETTDGQQFLTSFGRRFMEKIHEAFPDCFETEEKE